MCVLKMCVLICVKCCKKIDDARELNFNVCSQDRCMFSIQEYTPHSILNHWISIFMVDFCYR